MECNMTCTQALLSLLLISPCTDGGGQSIDQTKNPIVDQPIATALAHPQRLEGDLARDPLRKPDQVLAFFEIEPGMKMFDLFSGGGYYTEILSRLTGPSGSVLSHNNLAYLNFAKHEIAIRYVDNRLSNVTHLITEADALELPDASFDAVLAILTWHDFYYSHSPGWPEVDESQLVSNLCKAMKPGAVLGIIDHVAEAGSNAEQTGQELHRVDPQHIKDDLAGSCFEWVAEAHFLRNSADQYDKSVMDPAVRGKTDQVILKYRRT